MKKSLYLLTAAAFVLGGMTSCGDNDDFSKVHELSDVEAAEVARQDSIREAMLQFIDADLILSYTVTDQFRSTWSDKQCRPDMTEVAALFGMTVEEVYNGIVDGTITGFAIDSSTHNDYVLSGTTTNGVWGHWWNASGDVTQWSNGDYAFYCEWQDAGEHEEGEADDGRYFNVGQCPDLFTEPTTFTVHECLKYDGKRVAFAITYRIIDPTKSTVAGEADLEITLPVNPKGYTLNPLQFDLATVKRLLDCSEIDPVEHPMALLEDGSYTQTQTADYGFWYNSAGYVCGFSDSDAKVEVVYQPDNTGGEDTLGICLKPKKTEAGDRFKVKYGFAVDGFIYFFNITINVVEAEE